MIKEVSGDILLTDAQAIAHGVAPHDHFDSGLALSLRKNYPAMVKDYRHFCKQRHPKPGKVWMWRSASGVRIFNMLTQEPSKYEGGHPGAATIGNVDHALKALAKQIKKEKISSIALPKLATGYGKMEWEDIQPLIKKRLGDLKIPVYIYSLYEEGVKADES